MRPRIDAPEEFDAARGRLPSAAERSRDGRAVAELLIDFFRRDLLNVFPGGRFEPVDDRAFEGDLLRTPGFRLVESPDGTGDEVLLFGRRYRVGPRHGDRFSPLERRMIAAIGAVRTMQHDGLFQPSNPARMEIFRGGSEDHYIAAFVEPTSYRPAAPRPSRIAATIQTLRLAALSTYENHRVSTGALLVGSGDDSVHPALPAPPDALTYGVELTGFKSIHRLCDGKRTLFLVDRAGKLAGIVDVARFAAEIPEPDAADVPAPRAYHAHARATATGGHVCLVLSPNQEIKLFAEGAQACAFTHGRWRILDTAAKFAVWKAAVGSQAQSRALFQVALNLAESRQGALFVVVADPCAAVGPLLAPHDLLSAEVPCGPLPELAPRDPVAKRALHYLARGRDVTELDPPVLEALASLDGALVADRSGRLLAFGAILRHSAADLPNLATPEGARTTAGLVASRYGPVLKVSEDGIITCFLDGAVAWEL